MLLLDALFTLWYFYKPCSLGANAVLLVRALSLAIDACGEVGRYEIVGWYPLSSLLIEFC